MLESSELIFHEYRDSRKDIFSDFKEGLSGPLFLAADTTGKKYIVSTPAFIMLPMN